jgi:hypothetical protein
VLEILNDNATLVSVTTSCICGVVFLTLGIEFNTMSYEWITFAKIGNSIFYPKSNIDYSRFSDGTDSMPEFNIRTNGDIQIAGYNTGNYIIHLHYNL